MKQTIQVADKPTADSIKTTVESNAEKLDGIAQHLESGGMLADPDCGLPALKQYIDELKNYVGNGKRDVANAITEKGITTATDASFATLVDNIDKIVTLMQGTQDADVAAGDILFGKYCYAKGTKLMGTMPIRGAVSQSLAPNGIYTIPQGYHNGSGKVVQNLETRAAQTYTPDTANQTIPAGRFLTGAQTILGDANLIPANIKKGMSIFGVAGNADGDLTFRKNDVSTVGGNYGSQYNLRLVEFTPHTYPVNTPGGTVTGSCDRYGSSNRTLFFNAAETISNVVYLKEIQYSHGSSGYMGFRTEPQFAWNSPNLSANYSLYNGSITITGEDRLCLFFPNASANGEYSTITVKKVLAYCY